MLVRLVLIPTIILSWLIFEIPRIDIAAGWLQNCLNEINWTKCEIALG